MERIREALQRARQERNLTRLGDSNGFGSVAAGDGPEADVAHIVHAKTATVDVARDCLRENRVVSGFDPCLYTDAFKILSTQVSQRLTENGWRTLGVTSSGAQEGKTLVAINLAMSLATEINKTALLVDADLRQPRVRHYFGLESGRGLSDHFSSNVPVEELLVRAGDGGFVMLPGGTPLMNSSEMLGSRKMAALVDELRTRYPSTILVFDLPPVLTAADVLALAPRLDALLLVVEDGRTRREHIRRVEELLSSTRVIGTVLNKFSNSGTAEKPKRQARSR